MNLRIGIRHFVPAMVIALTLMASTSQATKVLFGGGQAEPTGGADAAAFTFLQDRYGSENVDYIRTNDGVAGDESPYDVFVISSTPGSGSIRNKWHNSETPILNWEEAVADNGAGEYMITAGRPKDNAADHTIEISVAHDITLGFEVGQIVQVTTGASELWWSTDEQAPGSTSLAFEEGDPSRMWLTIIDDGGELNGGGAATARQVMLGMTDGTFATLTDDGKQLFGQAVDWLAVPEPSSFVLIAMGLGTGVVLAARRRRRSV